eukprot:GHVS01084523.1.p1 GENE.GHVS01084523.1~~GHVS01084523.1.p1  ORF type:complete len:117 (+),score=17.80 GHVS01084523.1:101-451(+)
MAGQNSRRLVDVAGSVMEGLYRAAGLRTTTFRGSSLMVQCMGAAVVCYGPQDVAALALLGYGAYTGSKLRRNCQPQGCATGGTTQETYQRFLEAKGLEQADAKLSSKAREATVSTG